MLSFQRHGQYSPKQRTMGSRRWNTIGVVCLKAGERENGNARCFFVASIPAASAAHTFNGKQKFGPHNKLNPLVGSPMSHGYDH